MRREYEERVVCLDVRSMGRDGNVIEQPICSAADSLVQDVVFRTEGLKKGDEMYQTKFNSPNSSQSLLMNLCWETVEYNTLLQEAQALNSSLDDLLPYLDPASPRIGDVIASLQNLSKELADYFRNLFVKKRQPAATHVLINNGFRGEKKQKTLFPASAVRALSYHSRSIHQRSKQKCEIEDD